MRYILAAAALFLLSAPAHAAINHHGSVQHFCDVRYCSMPPEAAPRRAGSRRASSSRKARVYQRRAAIKRPVTIPVKLAVPGTLGAYRGEIAKPGPVADGLGNIRGLQTHFIAKLAALKAAIPAALGGGFNVGSGFRSHAEQARLHALKPRLAARPGRSKHEKGLAGDLRFASLAVSRWVHLNARKHGLRFPMRHEPWHIEPIGATRYAAKHRYAAAR